MHRTVDIIGSGRTGRTSLEYRNPFRGHLLLGTLGLDKGCNINISQSHPCLAARGLDIILLAYQYGPRDCLLHQCEGKKTGEPRWVATYQTWGGPLQDLEGS